MLGAIYAGALSRFSNPVNLKRLVNLIDEIEWTGLNIDVKAAAYEGLLEKSASEGKKGAGQYFTPRILIQCIVRCMKPDPRKTKDFTIHDPAAGTGGFLVCAYEWLMEKTKGSLERDEAKRILTRTYSGTELVPRPRRLALMNLYLHGIQANIYLGDAIYEPKRVPRDGGYDCIMTNPPFGTKGANQAPNRDDFTVATSNKQLNFVQHVMSILKPGEEVRACVLPKLKTNAIAKADCFCLRPRQDVVDRYYLTLQLVSRESYERLSGNIHGATRPRINTTHLRNLEVRICSLAEQQEIVRRVEAMFKLADVVEKRVAAATTRAEKLTQAILAKAFRGELVPTEAELARREGRSYETASDLLARIKGEREATKVLTSDHRRRVHKRQV
jgi:plasmid stability protein